MRRLTKAILATLLISATLATTVSAEPSRNQLQQSKTNTKNQIKTLESEMTATMKKINQTEESLVKVGEQIIEATADLQKAEEQEKVQYVAMKQRIVAMYENGNSSMIATVLEAESIADMLQQAENVQAIHAYDRKQLEEYVKTKEKIADLKECLEEDMAALQKKQDKLAKDKKSLDRKISDLEKKVDDLDQRIRRAAAAASPSKNNSGSDYVPPKGTGGGAAIVSEAYKYLGTPYVWGGMSSGGVDCSGLVLLAHKAIGVNLSHYSGSQGSGGRPVSKAEAQPGDVVCYSGHVGIYLGGGKMIHAPQTGDVVRVVSVYGNPWYRRYW